MQEGDNFNLYEQDYTGVEALATCPGGELFFAGVFTGAIPLTQYHGEPTIIIGKVVSEEDGEIVLEQAVAISPKQMKDVHFASDYSPMDCLRGLWFELKTIQPAALKDAKLPADQVKQRMPLFVKQGKEDYRRYHAALQS